jgi:hypothetical protein
MIARHMRAAARVSATELLLARSTAMFVTNLSERYVLSLSMLEPRISMGTRLNGSVTRTIERVRPADGAASDAVTVARIGADGAVLRELTLRRLVVERVRHEQTVPVQTSEVAAATADASMSTVTPPWQPAAQPGRHLAAMPLARPKPIALPAVPASITGHEEADARPTPARATAAAVNEREIERLTERVIGSIDRRLVAQRERFGRP